MTKPDIAFRRRPDRSPGVDHAPLALWGGIECTINRVEDRYMDQIALGGHDVRTDDLDRIASLGIAALRYPLLWESFARAPDPDGLWAWHDQRLARLRALGVRPILGLVHHGSGPPTTSLLSDDFASGLAEHAAAAARRYPWVRDWTPVNEPLTTARFSALYGHWFPHLRDERAFWHALVTQVEATGAAMREIRNVNPQARLIQTEDLGHNAATPERQAQADFYNQRRWASWDMLAGRFAPGHPLWDRVAGMGLRARLEANAAAPCVPDVLGLNHYLTSDRFLDHRVAAHPEGARGECALGPLADVEAVQVCDAPPGLDGALRACWDRYGLPIAITEVHNGCTREEQMRWIVEAWETAARLRAEGTAIEAVTLWSLLGSHDWDSLLIRADGHYESGIFDIRSQPVRETALAGLARRIAAGEAADHAVLRRAGWWRGHAPVPASPLGEGNTRAGVRPLLILGATGTLGQAFAGGCRLRGIDHVLTGRDRLDLSDPASIAKTLDELQPWAVVNAAGWVRVDDAEQQARDCFSANHFGAVRLAAACARRDIHYTCFSSDLVFDGRLRRPYIESDATAPLSIYGHSKARTDEALGAAPGALIIRTASFFSPFDRHNFAVHLAGALREDRRFHAAADCVTSPTYVPDLVRTTLDLVIDGEQGLWHLVSEGAISWAGFALLVAESLDLPSHGIDARPAAAMGWRAARPRNAALSSERGLIMPSLTSAIERFASELA